MPVFRIEHTTREWAADFAVQIAAMLLLLGLLVRYAPHGQHWSLVALVLAGMVTWTLIEYCVHRFILHGLQPWSSWHAQHHGHPLRHIFAPALLVAALFAALIFAPALWLGGLPIACGFTLGVLCGYLFYSLTARGCGSDNCGTPSTIDGARAQAAGMASL